MQPVGGGQVAGVEVAAPLRRRVLAHLADLVVDDLHTSGCGRIQQRGMQSRSPHAATRAGAESSSDTTSPVEVTNALKRLTRGIHAEAVQLLHGMGHQAFTARFVDGPATTFHHDNLEPGAGSVDRGGQAGRPPACHEQIDHRSLASAAFSTLIRVISNAALSIVNARAVTHAVCTSGSATPSRTTAT